MKIIVLEEGNEDKVKKAWKEIDAYKFKNLDYPEELKLHEDTTYKIYSTLDRLYIKELLNQKDDDEILCIELLALIIDDEGDLHLMYAQDYYSQTYEECSGYPNYYTHKVENIDIEKKVYNYRTELINKQRMINDITQWTLEIEQ